MCSSELIQSIADGGLDGQLIRLYGSNPETLRQQKARYIKLIERYRENFGETEELHLLSVPGRSEVGGNHTDHNHGRVLACSVNLDIIAAAAPCGDDRVIVRSEGFDEDNVSLESPEPVESEKGRSSSLVRGVCARLKALGYRTGGFRACTTSSVLKGSGLSSSAAFEVMVANIVGHLYNGGTIDAMTMAQVSQYAENEYFGKPSGLMDQTACAVGGFVAIDFRDTARPSIEKINFDFASTGHSLCIVDTGGNHADLTGEYSAIRSEMKSIANFFGRDYLRECSEDRFYAGIPELKKKVPDRAILRAMHFFADNKRVEKLTAALKSNDFEQFKKLITESGRSSFMYLQNCYSVGSPLEQGVPLALALCEHMLLGRGAWRVHGGGFAGTVQAFVPDGLLEEFRRTMDGVFGADATYILNIRPVGACLLV